VSPAAALYPASGDGHGAGAGFGFLLFDGVGASVIFRGEIRWDQLWRRAQCQTQFVERRVSEGRCAGESTACGLGTWDRGAKERMAAGRPTRWGAGGWVTHCHESGVARLFMP
jgi:hypothetical protein